MDRGWAMGRRSGVAALAALGLGAILFHPAAWAQPGAAPAQAGAPQPQAGPPAGQTGAPAARAVRLSSVDGTVELSQGSQVIAEKAVVNTPLFEGTQLVTQQDGRAEVQFEDGSVIRITPNSSVTLAVLRTEAAGGTEVTVNGGLAYLEVQGGAQPTHFAVHFGDSGVSVSGSTVLRIDMDTPPGEMAVFAGNAHLERGGGPSGASLDLHGGESVALKPDPAQYALAESIEPDSWDSWNSDRDQVLTSEANAKTAATGSYANPAWADLDANGNWYDVPGQGYVWSPNDAASPGWDPYGNGNWVNSPGYGYMWASGDSWGYLPFNCGMWSFYNGFGWGWAPGIGGCSPWWGYGGYITNIGYAPFGYLPPRRPRGPGRIVGGHPIGGGRNYPAPMIPVNKRPPSGFGPQTPRDRFATVTIAGHTVQPLHPLSPRPVYDHSSSPVFAHGTLPGAHGPGAPGTPGAVIRGTGAPLYPGTAHPLAPAQTHPGGPAPTARPASAPRPAAPRSAPAPAPHPSGGGGGGGGAHPSGGSPHK